MSFYDSILGFEEDDSSADAIPSPRLLRACDLSEYGKKKKKCCKKYKKGKRCGKCPKR